MAFTRSNFPKIPLFAVALLLLALPVVLFWRSGFFFINDDWTALIQMVKCPFRQYLFQPDGEQLFPLFHLIFYGLVKIAGEDYSLLVLINCLGSGVNAFLLYLFFRRHWNPGLALVLALVYAGAALHHAIAWNAFYVCYLLSLGFFLGALLLTDSYLRSPSWGRLLGIGVCAGLSIFSHNYSLLALGALPLYAILQGGMEGRRQSRALGLIVGVVYLIFALGYITFAGMSAATSHNRQILFSLPSPAYLLHLFYGAFLSPFFYLFWGHFHFPVWAMVLGVVLLIFCLAVIWRGGETSDKRLILWGLSFNALPFLLISLTRYQRSVAQAFVARYGIFTLIGALLIIGTAWRILAARIPYKLYLHLLTLGVLAAFVGGQLLSLPIWRQKYLSMSRVAATCYHQLSRQDLAPEIPPAIFQKFCPTAHPTLTPDQVVAIRRFLTGTAQKP